MTRLALSIQSLFLFAVITCLTLAVPTQANTIDWTSTSSGQFGDENNWDGSVPGTSDIARFGVNETYLVTFFTDHTNQAANVTAGNVTLNLVGGDYTLNGILGSSGGTNLLSVNNGELRITGGTLAANGADTPGSPNNTWIRVGGNGTLVIDGPDAVLSAPSVDASRFEINGTTRVIDGGLLETAKAFTIGGSGTLVEIEGAGSRIIRTGGRLDMQSGGTVHITQGGYMQDNSNDNIINNGGSVLISDVGSQWDYNELSVARAGYGELRILDGGVAHGTGVSRITDNAGGEGYVLVAGTDSRWQVDGTLDVGNNSQDAISATLEINDGGEVSVDNVLNIGGIGIVTGNGGLITGNVNNIAGTVAPGNSAGTLAMLGNYTQGADGLLQMEIGGTIVGDEYDQFEIAGNLNLDGTLQILQLNNYEPIAGDTFQLLNFTGTVTGTFASIDAFELAPDLFWNFDDLYTTGTISVIPEPASVMLLAAGSCLLMSRRRR